VNLDRNRVTGEGVKQQNSDPKILDDSKILEQYWAMKYLGVFLLTLLLVLSVETSAQDNPFSKGGQGGSVIVPGQDKPCPDYKIIIITPPGDVDFKMTVNTPAKNIDPGIVFKPCTESNQLAFAPQMILPNQKQVIMSDQEMSDYLKGILLLSGKKK
jgi:hypothetical protein